MMFYVTRFIFSNTTSRAIHQLSVINQAVNTSFEHILSVITHKAYVFPRLLAFDESVNTLLDTGVLDVSGVVSILVRIGFKSK
jgi:hypothetical protein